MRKLLDINNPIMRGLVAIFDMIVLSVLWVVFSLPVFTMGAASAALYHAVYHHVRKGEDYLFSSFWTAFKENFKRQTLCWLLPLGLLILLTVDAIVLRGRYLEAKPFGWLYYAVLTITAFVLVWTVYLAAYGARFNGSVKEVLKYSFILFRAHPLLMLAVMALVLGGIALALTLPALVILIPAGVYLGATFPIEAAFRKHMRPEDLERIREEKGE